MLTKLAIGCAVVALASMTMAAPASVIEFVHEGVGSGTLDGQSFGVGAPVPFIITAYSDTDDRVSFGNGFAIQHTAASIAIDGVGVFDFLVPTRTFVNHISSIVGFSRSTDGGASGLDLFNGPTNAAFGAWDMLSSIGPFSGQSQLLQWNDDPPIQTSGGVLVFNDQLVPGTFTATVLPAPGAVALLGVAGLVGARRRRA
jgi:hypothetical protein